MSKQRLSASVDSDLITAVENVVAQGRVDSVSAWVNEAIRLKLAQDRRLEALADFVAAYESEHGEITVEEMALATRRAGAAAITVRGNRPVRSRATRASRRSKR